VLDLRRSTALGIRFMLTSLTTVIAAFVLLSPAQALATGSDRLVYTHDPYAQSGYSGENVLVNPIDIADADGDNHSEIFGGEAAGVTCPCTTSDPALSPDGSTIVFALTDSTTTNIWAFNFTNNTPPYQISDASDGDAGYFEPAWSPDGSRVLARYSSVSSGADELRVINMNAPGIATLYQDDDGGLNNPTYSPDGNHIAFADDGSLYEMDSAGTGRHEVLGPVETENALCGLEIYGGPSICSIRNPVYSPSGEHFAFEAGGQIFTADRDGYNASQVSCTKGGEKPAWSGDGSHIAYREWRETSGYTMSQVKTVRPDGSDGHLLIPDDGGTRYSDPSFKQASGTLAHDPPFTRSHCPDTDALLYRYSPQLRYDQQENYFADSAAEITDNWYGGVSNKLVTNDGAPLAWSEPGHGPWRLDLYSLGDLYPPGFAASGSDWIDEDNSDYSGDAYRLHNLGYGNHIYGRAVRGSDGKYWLQYWMFYYYNDYALGGVGVHEGDWEMVQVGLDQSDQPDRVTFARHDYSARCDWNEIETFDTGDGPAPVVYVALGSHASYATEGEQLTAVATDDTADDGPHVRPELELVHDDSPGWIRWPGHWGNSRGGFLNSTSPRTPSEQGSWKDPTAFDDDAGPCSTRVGAKRSSSRRVVRATAPKISARLVRGHVRLRYRFKASARSRLGQSARLVVSVRTPRRDAPARTREFRIRGARGTLFYPALLRPGRYTVLVSSYSKTSRRSRIVRAPLMQ
jgi:hypothetical protein